MHALNLHRHRSNTTCNGSHGPLSDVGDGVLGPTPDPRGTELGVFAIGGRSLPADQLPYLAPHGACVAAEQQRPASSDAYAATAGQRPATANIRGATVYGIDLGNNIFVGTDPAGNAVQRLKFRRDTLLIFFERANPTLVGMEACPGP